MNLTSALILPPEVEIVDIITSNWRFYILRLLIFQKKCFMYMDVLTAWIYHMYVMPEKVRRDH